MQAIQIEDHRLFMSHLLTGKTFYGFDLSEGSITTFVRLQISGSFCRDYFDTEEESGRKVPEQPFVPWEYIQPHIRELIRGRHKPLHLRLVLRLSGKNTARMLSQTGLSVSEQDVSGLFLNISFEPGKLTCTTGCSLMVFSPDRAVEHAWDEMVLKFFHQQQIPCSLI